MREVNGGAGVSLAYRTVGIICRAPVQNETMGSMFKNYEDFGDNDSGA